MTHTPSGETPHVVVEADGAKMQFWIKPDADRDRERVEATLQILPEGDYGWRFYATRGTRGTKWEGDSFGTGLNHPNGCSFTLTVSGDGCSGAAFDAAYATFMREVRKVVFG